MLSSTDVVKNINVRPMDPEDLSSVIEIDRETTGLQRALTYRDQINTYLGGELSLSYVAESGNEIVGFMLGRVRDLRHGIYEGAWIEVVGVRNAYKRRGIGQKLLTAFEEGCRKRGVKTIHIVVDAADPEIKPFVESVGFREGPQVHLQKQI